MKTVFTMTVGLFLWMTAFYIQLNKKHEALEKQLSSEIERMNAMLDSLESACREHQKDVAKYVIMDSENRRVLKAKEIFKKAY